MMQNVVVMPSTSINTIFYQLFVDEIALFDQLNNYF